MAVLFKILILAKDLMVRLIPSNPTHRVIRNIPTGSNTVSRIILSRCLRKAMASNIPRRAMASSILLRVTVSSIPRKVMASNLNSVPHSR